MRALRDLGGTRAERVKRCENAKGHSRNIGLFKKERKRKSRLEKKHLQTPTLKSQILI